MIFIYVSATVNYSSPETKAIETKIAGECFGAKSLVLLEICTMNIHKEQIK